MSAHVSAAWLAAIDAWILWNLAQGNSSQTAYTRRQHLQRTARSIGIESPWEVTGPELLSWFASQQWANETRRAYRTTLRGFYRWGAESGHIGSSPALALPKVKPGLPNPRPAPDSVYLPALAAARPRERLMLRLAADHGMRRGEIALVHSRDLLEDLDGWSLVVHGKGGKERILPLLDDVAATLQSLPPGWVFPGDDHGHLSPRWVGKLVNRLLADDWTIHKLRHRAATIWEETSGHDIFGVQELLGHASPATTRLYTKVKNDRLRGIVNGASGPSPPLATAGRPARRRAA
ncbi:tyrosine-type recombinase/integrase [Nocardioides sp.]|uniref:tyrosine-type recombinase/integrase n=1 Tax=Nocardioides sp. TaxID=35761 RepID=UPI0026114CD6|nr:tyrosine-type recombinase/integrase [Nocardioides sp.]MDI6911511.1 tyrosine-type recombinase/integrase [Nocardioides sp.]